MNISIKLKFFIAIIVLFIILYINIYIYPTVEFFYNIEELIAISYETDANNSEVNNLKRVFEKYNYKYKILGNGEVWRSWYGRSKSYSDFINTLDDNIYVVICDGRDVLVNQSSKIFLENGIHMRKKYGERIIIGTEKSCCTGNLDIVYRAKNIPENIVNFQELYMLQQRHNSIKNSDNDNEHDKLDFYYINFGLMFGKAIEFKNLFKILNVQPNQDDQALLHKAYYEDPNLLYLDHKQELFSNSSNKICDFIWDLDINGFKNTYTKTTPCFIHIPSRQMECYNYLLSKLLP